MKRGQFSEKEFINFEVLNSEAMNLVRGGAIPPKTKDKDAFGDDEEFE